METKVADKKKKSEKAKKLTSVRQQKKDSIERNINAALEAVTKYGTK